MVAIRDTRIVYDGWLKLRLAILSGNDGVAFRREIEDHGAAVAVLPYDPERRVALLVTLPRAPLLFKGVRSNILEAPAGILEEGEAPSDGAAREAWEEAGVALAALEPAGTAWSMCGVLTEKMHLFLAPFREADRSGAGGGLAEEHENITVVEIALSRLAALADANDLADMKTLALVQTLRLKRPELFD